MILLICGGRSFNEYHTLDASILRLPQLPELIIQGGAPGADKLAKRWAKINHIHCAEVPAMWEAFRNKAGSYRNAAMLLLKPDVCLAMPGGSGTANMVDKCQNAGITVIYS